MASSRHLAIQFAQKGGYQVAAIGRGPENAALATKLGASVYIDSAGPKAPAIKMEHQQRKRAAAQHPIADGLTLHRARRAAPGERAVRSGPAFCSTLTARWWTASTDTSWLGGREALEEAGIELAVWRIHHRIGMSGDCSRTLCCGRSDIR